MSLDFLPFTFYRILKILLRRPCSQLEMGWPKSRHSRFWMENVDSDIYKLASVCHCILNHQSGNQEKLSTCCLSNKYSHIVYMVVENAWIQVNHSHIHPASAILLDFKVFFPGNCLDGLHWFCSCFAFLLFSCYNSKFKFINFKKFVTLKGLVKYLQRMVFLKNTVIKNIYSLLLWHGHMHAP